MPTPSAPSAAAVKLVAMEKKITVPPSRTRSSVDSSVPGTLAQFTTRSNSPPADSTRCSASTPRVASSSRVRSTTPMVTRSASAFSFTSAATTSPDPAKVSLAWAQTSAPDFPAPITSTRAPGRAWRATSAGAPQTSRAASASLSGMSEGSRDQWPVAKRMALPRTSIRSTSGWTARISSIRSGVSVSETSVAMRSPGARSSAAGLRGPTARTRPMSIPPEPVTGLCILPRSRTIRPTSSPMRAASRPTSSEICLKLAESMLRASTSMESSSSPSGRSGSSRSARWGSTPAGEMTRLRP